MMWHDFVEEFIGKLDKLPPQPWAVTVDVWSNSHLITTPDGTILLSVPIPGRKDDESDLAWGFRISEQFQFLFLLVSMVNHSGIWFDVMRSSDILPKKPDENKEVRKKEVLVIPEKPEVFNVAHLIAESPFWTKGK